MISFKDMMKYTPPNISVFQKHGKGGYLRKAKYAVDWGRAALFDSRVELRDDPEWGSKPEDVPERDLVQMYAYWTIADDMLKRLERMDAAEREKQLALDTKPELEITFDKVSADHADLTGMIVAWEDRDGKEKLYPALDRQLKRRMDTWEKGLEWAKKSNFESDGDPFESIEEFCQERDIIEYAVMGLDVLRLNTPGRLDPLPYLDTFVERRLKLDEKFREVLKGRYVEAPWAELPQFWWHHPYQK